MSRIRLSCFTRSTFYCYITRINHSKVTCHTFCVCSIYRASWELTHWGQVTHICVGKLTIICSDNGLAPSRRQAIIWTNDGILLTGPLGTNFSEILIEILTSSFKNMHLKMSSGKWQPFCLGLNVLSTLIMLHYSSIAMGCLSIRPFVNLTTIIGSAWNS